MSIAQANEVSRKLWEIDVPAWHALWVPIFQRFARDLVIDANLSPGKVVLDVGTGTGVAAFEAARRVKPDGFVFGIDRLASMLVIGKKAAEIKGQRNLRFVLMEAEHLLFPNEVFDAVTSNCGMPSIGFRESITDVFRVLRKGGVFVYNDWRLKDVPVHRIFSEILQQHRTKYPSRKLETQRRALATLELFGNRDMNLDAQLRELSRAGFQEIEVKTRNYKVLLQGVEGYLEMRFRRAALKQELTELSAGNRKKMVTALKDGLKPFIRGRHFVFNWKVTFVRGQKM